MAYARPGVALQVTLPEQRRPDSITIVLARLANIGAKNKK